MRRNNLKKVQRGQGLPEYALIIALVALVAVVILGIVGLAATRNFGLVAGALGVRKDAYQPSADFYIYFNEAGDNNPPQCGKLSADTVLYAQMTTNIDPSNLTVATENANINVRLAENVGAVSPIGNLLVQATLPPDTPCPVSLVIQSDKAHGGITVAWNILQQDFPISSGS